MPSATTDRKKRSTAQTRRSTARPNRAQLRAAEIRAAESGAIVTGGVAPAAVATGRSRPMVRSFVLSRDAEMNYVRKDLKRLIITAGILFVLMIALLIILD
jgi:hypothetical protein